MNVRDAGKFAAGDKRWEFPPGRRSGLEDIKDSNWIETPLYNNNT